ncbi:hypothetical protein HELRODRAFT_91810 [Helobdella robusta]|uniref:RRM domain-containing protein n=1 Tax=Helobdella robusta TaxID=6412 RepID=T1G893_HELRO|nr:hypothetical protein HELRODRAFT_91810 [Helobdella robusta]ESO10462.1 hypothetical protein HELRODRAFT_91810 [Helobdella robusta]
MPIADVDYGTTSKELEEHFVTCGPIKRTTILCDKFSGKPKRFAFLEFLKKESLVLASELNRSMINGDARRRPKGAAGRGQTLQIFSTCFDQYPLVNESLYRGRGHRRSMRGCRYTPY